MWIKRDDGNLINLKRGNSIIKYPTLGDYFDVIISFCGNESYSLKNRLTEKEADEYIEMIQKNYLTEGSKGKKSNPTKQ